MTDADPLQFKFILIEASGAGETSIATSCGREVRRRDDITTIEGRTIKLMISDTAGQERFYTIAKVRFMDNQ
jgi:GTPase SAR1 family protein